FFVQKRSVNVATATRSWSLSRVLLLTLQKVIVADASLSLQKTFVAAALLSLQKTFAERS
ncbi:hypothetical protein, partial [Lysinibacillus sp. NPDC096212]|uniref:hypothetical protein n=1 Tax=Lysinibacillus sp. NPDC096212 TaxID=3364135 RepID=UPI00380D43D1